MPLRQLGTSDSVGCDHGKWVPIWLPGVEQGADAVVAEAAEFEGDPLDPKGQDTIQALSRAENDETKTARNE